MSDTPTLMTDAEAAEFYKEELYHCKDQLAEAEREVATGQFELLKAEHLKAIAWQQMAEEAMSGYGVLHEEIAAEGCEGCEYEKLLTRFRELKGGAK